MKKSITLVLFFCFTNLFGQSREYNYFLRETKIADDSQTKIVINEKNDTILLAHYKTQDLISKTYKDFTKTYKGTPFFKNGWYKGFVTTKFDKDLNLLMAYNIQKGVVYIVTNPAIEASPSKPLEFSIENHTFKLINDFYYENIYTGKIELLKEYSCNLHILKSDAKTGYDTEGGESEFDGEFQKTVKYYLWDGITMKFLPNNKQIFKNFGNNKKALENYVKSKNLNLKNENSLIELIKYFETL